MQFQALGFRPPFQGTGLSFRLMVSGFRVQSSVLNVWGSWINVWDVGCMVWGIVVWVWGVDCTDHSSGFGV